MDVKKKILLLVIALFVALTCLTACNSYASTLQDLQSLLKVRYSEVVLSTTTTTSDITLKGIYTMTFESDKTTVDYSFDRLNGLSLDGNNADRYKDTIQGCAVVQNGSVIEGDTSVELPQELDFSGISFKQAFFKNYTISNTKFDADVAYPAGFTGGNVECSDMHVTVLYSHTALKKIEITYTSNNGADVKITYLFTK